LIEARLETGRTHQIRVHFKDHGHPVLGDQTYARPPRDPRLREVAKTLGRQALHAHVLGLVHPKTDQYLEWSAPMPADMQAAIAALR
jgi:23S rRNA pseudouridine1911/1915/1917 synthase